MNHQNSVVVVMLALTLPAPALSQDHRLTQQDFTSAARCGECHREIYNQWSQSMHSRSFKDPIYRQVLEKLIQQQGPRNQVFCLSCHAPVASVAGATLGTAAGLDWDAFSGVATEGVTCDFCHTLPQSHGEGKGISVGRYVYPRRGSTAVKYGRHSDAQTQDHPIRVGEFLTSARVCSTCHHFRHPVSNREVQSTYQEWLRGPYSQRGRRCQDCHMPVYSGRSATRGKERHDLHAHVFLGGHTQMIQKAATVTVFGVAERLGDNPRLSVTVSTRNSGAGHSIPTGVPGVRQMWLRVTVLDSKGTVLGRRRFRYGQRLVTRDGTSPALPWEAYRVAEDRRIPPEQALQDRFTLELPSSLRGNVQVRAELFLQLISETLSRRLRIEPQEPHLMTKTEVSVVVPEAGLRRRKETQSGGF